MLRFRLFPWYAGDLSLFTLNASPQRESSPPGSAAADSRCMHVGMSLCSAVVRMNALAIPFSSQEPSLPDAQEEVIETGMHPFPNQLSLCQPSLLRSRYPLTLELTLGVSSLSDCKRDSGFQSFGLKVSFNREIKERAPEDTGVRLLDARSVRPYARKSEAR